MKSAKACRHGVPAMATHAPSAEGRIPDAHARQRVVSPAGSHAICLARHAVVASAGHPPVGSGPDEESSPLHAAIQSTETEHETATIRDMVSR